MPGQDSKKRGFTIYDFLFNSISPFFSTFPLGPSILMTPDFFESPESYNKLNKNNLEVE